MNINDVLQLDKTSQSIKKIDLFLADCNKNSTDYYEAFTYRAMIMHSLGKTNEALKALYQTIANYNLLNEDSIVLVCDAIINITIDVKRLDQAKKYIEFKAKYLKVSKSHLYTKDLIRYHIVNFEYGKAEKLINNYLNEFDSKEESLWAYEQLAVIYYKEYQYDKYLELSNKLEGIYQEMLNIKALQELYFSKLNIYYEQGNYVKLIGEANNYLNENDITSSNKLKTANLLIKSYLKSKDYRKAAIIESNYEEYINEVDNDIAIAFAKTALDLYTQTNSLVSIQQYQSLINKLEGNKKNEKIVSRKPKNIVIPTINEEAERVNVPILERIVGQSKVSTIENSSKDINVVYVSKAYEELSILFKTINGLDINTKFREVYRIMGIELCKITPIKEIYLVTYQNKYLGLHYKKERAYDKKLEFSDLEGTINALAINLEQEIYLDNNSEEGIKNIVKGTDYEEIPFGVSFPLFKEDIVFGSIAYFSDEAFLQQDMVYEILKLVTQMVNARLIAIIKQNELELSNKRMFFVYEHTTSGTKELMEQNIHLSHQAVQMLGVMEDLLVTDYESFIHPDDLAMYRSCINDVYLYLTMGKSVEYHFKKNNSYLKIKETFYPSYENGIISIYSLIEDITALEKNQNELIDLAYTHPISKLESQLKLIVDIKKEMQNKKFALALLDVRDFKIYADLYGLNFVNQLIYAIACELKEAFSNEFYISVYHLESDKYALLFKGVNDRRVIDSLLKKKLDIVAKKLNFLNNRLNIWFNCGVFRVAKNSPNLDEQQVISYAMDALTEAKLNYDLVHNINHYDSEAAKLRFNENQLITHISESIDHGKIGISYKQIANIKNQEVFAYYAQISLDNYEVDEAYMKQVIKRRNLEDLIDKYLISNVSKELKMLYEELRASVKVFIDITKASYTNKLISFIEQQSRFYHSTKNNIVFVVDDASHYLIKQLRSLNYLVASKNLMDIYNQNIDYYILDINQTNNISEIKELCHNKECVLVLGGIDSKEDIEKAINLDISYVYGKYYRKNIRMKKLIDANHK